MTVMSLAYESLQYSLSYSAPELPKEDARPPFLEFFAGSGLVSHALAPYFCETWANDICPKKAAVFWANHEGAPFSLCSITNVSGKCFPSSVLS
jgi:DNA (cytosine-5)-methyltransferase 1